MAELAHSDTMLPAQEVADIIDSYTALIEEMLADTPGRTGGMAYLPSERAWRMCRDAAYQLSQAHDSLCRCGRLWTMLQTDDGWRHPVDLIRQALDAVTVAKNEMLERKGDPMAPEHYNMPMMRLAKAVQLADEDIRGLLGMG